MAINIAEVIHGYVEALLWSESCNGSMPTADGDHVHSTTEPQDCDDSLDYLGFEAADLAPEAVKEIESDVAGFVEANAADLQALIDTGRCNEGQIGHDFLLSRNGHGAGFFDRGYGPAGDRLQDAAQVYGTMGACVGDDGQTVYVHG